jgi:hypothetical protein
MYNCSLKVCRFSQVKKRLCPDCMESGDDGMDSWYYSRWTTFIMRGIVQIRCWLTLFVIPISLKLYANILCYENLHNFLPSIFSCRLLFLAIKISYMLKVWSNAPKHWNLYNLKRSGCGPALYGCTKGQASPCMSILIVEVSTCCVPFHCSWPDMNAKCFKTKFGIWFTRRVKICLDVLLFPKTNKICLDIFGKRFGVHWGGLPMGREQEYVE